MHYQIQTKVTGTWKPLKGFEVMEENYAKGAFDMLLKLQASMLNDQFRLVIL